MAARLAIAVISVVLTVACGSGEVATLCPAGAASCSCYNDGTCQGLLLCADGVCAIPRCGDDVVQAGENCDAGEKNSDSEPDRCRADCTLPRCGDEVTDASLGEECDEGVRNSDAEPNRCRTDCSLPVCGDGVLDNDFSEVCDDAEANTVECVMLENCLPGCREIKTCLCVDPIAVPCPTELATSLVLQPTSATGLIDNTAVADGWETFIDARAGGFNASPPDAYVYGRFTDQGLVKVDLDDLAATESMDWHIAFRRFVLRLNGGTSGPACTAAAALSAQTGFDDVSEVPNELSFGMDAFFNESCGWIPDSSGMTASPNTALANYWMWSGCVRMTGTVFVVELPDTRHLKIEVTHYYDADGQQLCQDTGTAGLSAISGEIRLRWAFLD